MPTVLPLRIPPGSHPWRMDGVQSRCVSLVPVHLLELQDLRLAISRAISSKQDEEAFSQHGKHRAVPSDRKERRGPTHTHPIHQAGQLSLGLAQDMGSQSSSPCSPPKSTRPVSSAWVNRLRSLTCPQLQEGPCVQCWRRISISTMQKLGSTALGDLPFRFGQSLYLLQSTR